VVMWYVVSNEFEGTNQQEGKNKKKKSRKGKKEIQTQTLFDC